jgi:hypothetical protein
MSWLVAPLTRSPELDRAGSYREREFNAQAAKRPPHLVALAVALSLWVAGRGLGN